jgi:hypothetical protein
MTQRRQELIEKVVDEGKTILYVAKKLRMKYCVARRIVGEEKKKRSESQS